MNNKQDGHWIRPVSELNMLIKTFLSLVFIGYNIKRLEQDGHASPRSSIQREKDSRALRHEYSQKIIIN